MGRLLQSGEIVELSSSGNFKDRQLSILSMEDDLSDIEEPGSMLRAASEPAPPTTYSLSRTSLLARRKLRLDPVVISRADNNSFAGTASLPLTSAPISAPRRTALDERFDLKGIVGHGSTCKVFRATRRCDGKEVALKVFSKDHDGAMVKREFDILKKVKHPNVVRLLDAGLIQGKSTLVLEFVAGQSLSNYVSSLRHDAMEDSSAWPIYVKLVSAVEYLHEQSVIHRDIKPENIVVTAECNDCRLVDYGSACDTSTMEPLTPVISPAYASPEVLAGGSPDQASDIWGIGICLLFMLAGHVDVDHTATSSAKFALRCRESLWRCLNSKPSNRPPARTLLRGLNSP